MEKIYGRTVGERIRLLRESEGLRQEDLANEFHMAHGGVISAYEKEYRRLSTEMVVKYSRRFNVTTDWILKGEDG